MDRTRFPELEEESVKIQPMPIDNFPDGLPDVCAGIVEIVLVGDMDRDSLKVFIVERDGLKCHSDPLGASLALQRSASLRLVDAERSIWRSDGVFSTEVRRWCKRGRKTIVPSDHQALERGRTPYHQGIYPSEVVLPTT